MDGRFWVHGEKSNRTTARPPPKRRSRTDRKITKRPSLPTAAPDEEH